MQDARCSLVRPKLGGKLRHGRSFAQDEAIALPRGVIVTANLHMSHPLHTPRKCLSQDHTQASRRYPLLPS